MKACSSMTVLICFSLAAEVVTIVGYYVYYVSVWLPLLHPQRVYLQSAEGNWKADGISLVSQAEVRVSVWLRDLPLSGRGRCEAHHLPARPPVSHSPHCSLIWCTHRVNKHASLRRSQTPNYPIPQVSLSPTAPRSLSHTETTLHGFRVFIFPN